MKQDNSIRTKLSQADQDELQKCKQSPVYFYNKYVRKEGWKELSESEYENFVKEMDYIRNCRIDFDKRYANRPVIIPESECCELPTHSKADGIGFVGHRLA